MQKFFSLLLVVGGLYLAAWLGPRQLMDGARSSEWAEASGTITAIEVVRESGSSSSGHYYRVPLRFRFVVDGVELEGSRYDVSGTPDFARRVEADSFAARHAIGTTHVVHYDPADPRAAVLSVGTGWRAWRTLGLGLLLLGLGGLEFLPRRRGRSRTG